MTDIMNKIEDLINEALEKQNYLTLRKLRNKVLEILNDEEMKSMFTEKEISRLDFLAGYMKMHISSSKKADNTEDEYGSVDVDELFSDDEEREEGDYCKGTPKHIDEIDAVEDEIKYLRSVYANSNVKFPKSRYNLFSENIDFDKLREDFQNIDPSCSVNVGALKTFYKQDFGEKIDKGSIHYFAIQNIKNFLAKVPEEYNDIRIPTPWIKIDCYIGPSGNNDDGWEF